MPLTHTTSYAYLSLTAVTTYNWMLPFLPGVYDIPFCTLAVVRVIYPSILYGAPFFVNHLKSLELIDVIEIDPYFAMALSFLLCLVIISNTINFEAHRSHSKQVMSPLLLLTAEVASGPTYIAYTNVSQLETSFGAFILFKQVLSPGLM